jgi:hypothetical protein
MHTILESQYRAAIEMLRRAIAGFPEELWNAPDHGNRTWRIAYHALFYADLYLSPSVDAFAGWEHAIPDANFMGTPIGEAHNTREELLGYADMITARLGRAIAALPMDGGSGFEWLPFSRLELHVYNIRHIQHHAGQLIERLRSSQERGIDWVGRGSMVEG